MPPAQTWRLSRPPQLHSGTGNFPTLQEKLAAALSTCYPVLELKPALLTSCTLEDLLCTRTWTSCSSTDKRLKLTALTKTEPTKMKANFIPWWHPSLYNDMLDVSWQRLMTLGKEPRAARLVGEEDLCKRLIHLPYCPLSPFMSHGANHAHRKTVKSQVWTGAREFGVSSTPDPV